MPNNARVVVFGAIDFERALAVFRRQVQEARLKRELKRRSQYHTPSEARKLKAFNARRRKRRKAA